MLTINIDTFYIKFNMIMMRIIKEKSKIFLLTRNIFFTMDTLPDIVAIIRGVCLSLLVANNVFGSNSVMRSIRFSCP